MWLVGCSYGGVLCGCQGFLVFYYTAMVLPWYHIWLTAVTKDVLSVFSTLLCGF